MERNPKHGPRETVHKRKKCKTYPQISVFVEKIIWFSPKSCKIVFPQWTAQIWNSFHYRADTLHPSELSQHWLGESLLVRTRRAGTHGQQRSWVSSDSVIHENSSLWPSTPHIAQTNSVQLSVANANPTMKRDDSKQMIEAAESDMRRQLLRERTTRIGESKRRFWSIEIINIRKFECIQESYNVKKKVSGN